MTHVEYNARASEREIRRAAINHAAYAAMAAVQARHDRAATIACWAFIGFVVAGTAILWWVSP